MPSKYKNSGLVNHMCNRVEAATVEGIAAFHSLNPGERRLLSTRLQIQSYDEGDVVINQLHKERNVYFIVNGVVRVCMNSNNGKEVQFEDLRNGEMFGELAAIDGIDRSSDCISLTETTMVSLSQADFLFALDTYTGFNRYVMRRLTRIARTHMGRVFEYSAHSVGERLHFELYRLALSQGHKTDSDITIQNVPTHADLAARISTHREAVTRELKKLEAAGIVTWNRRKHVVHDLVALSPLNSNTK